MRDILKVVNSIIEVIPEDENRGTLLQKLNYIKDTAPYTPPEAMDTMWGRLSVAVNKVLPLEEESFVVWEKKMVNILIDEHRFDV